jgi:hypothetical protein
MAFSDELAPGSAHLRRDFRALIQERECLGQLPHIARTIKQAGFSIPHKLPT